MKKIYITEKQLVDFIKLDETIQQYVNKKPGQTIDAAIKDAARDSAREAPNAEIDFVISKDEVNEDANNSTNVVDENETVTITKKQIKEAITKKRIAESKVYTKKDLKKMCK